MTADYNNVQTAKAATIIGTLTGVRGFAAIWVVLHHLRNMFGNYYSIPDFNVFVLRGYLGVDLFAFVSGFIITHTYHERFYQFTWRATFDFLWLRFARTYPLDLFVLTVFVVFLVMERGSEVLELLPYDKGFTHQLFLLNGLGLETEWK